MSIRRPSNTSSSVTAPCLPMSGAAPSTSTMGSRRRAAAMASPSLVWAFSRTRKASSSAWKVLRSTIVGAPSSFLMMSFIVRSLATQVLGEVEVPQPDSPQSLVVHDETASWLFDSSTIRLRKLLRGDVTERTVTAAPDCRSSATRRASGARISEIQEPVSIEALVAQLALETLHVRVLGLLGFLQDLNHLV